MKKVKIIILIIIAILTGFYFWPDEPLDTTKKIDKILVIKHKKLLQVFSGDKLLKSYKVALGKDPVGKKEIEGDKKTPEGTYIINDKNPNSNFHLNLGISYPNHEDIKNAKKLGKSPGGQIKIHGLKNGYGFIRKFHKYINWTLGCIAVTNKEVEELYHNVPIGTEIEILP